MDLSFICENAGIYRAWHMTCGEKKHVILIQSWPQFKNLFPVFIKSLSCCTGSLPHLQVCLCTVLLLFFFEYNK